MSDRWFESSNLDPQDGQATSIKQTLARTDLKALADRALHCRQKTDPNLAPAVHCNVDATRVAFGRYNVVLRVEFSDEVLWVARIRLVDDESGDINRAARALDNEIATMRLVRARTTIPVPAIYDFSGEHDAPTNIGALYVLMEFVPGGHVPKGFAKSIPSEYLIAFAHQFGDILYQLSTLRFNAIGVINESKNTDSSSSFTVLPTTIDADPVHLDDSSRDATPVSTSLEYFFAERKSLNDAALESSDPPDPSLLAAARFLLQAVPSAILPAYLRGPFLLAHPDMHHNNILVDSSHKIVAVLDWSDLMTVPIEKFATNPEFITYPGLSAEENAPILRFKKEVAGKIRSAAEDRGDKLGQTLADLIVSPKMDLVHRLTYTYPWRIKIDAMLVLRILYGNVAKWEDFEKLILDSPMGVL